MADPRIVLSSAHVTQCLLQTADAHSMHIVPVHILFPFKYVTSRHVFYYYDVNHVIRNIFYVWVHGGVGIMDQRSTA